MLLESLIIEKIGWKAQSKLSPENRKNVLSLEDIQKLQPKLASVLLLLYKKNSNWYFPLILRKEYNGVHSNEIGLPGGKKELEDSTFLDTAIRETQEEIGIMLPKATFYNELSYLYIPPSHFLVYPFLGISDNNFTFVPDSTEVETIYEVALEDLLNAEIQVEAKNNINIPYFELNSQKVWGATAMILNEAREILNSLILS